jgi:hypothetical protein
LQKTHIYSWGDGRKTDLHSAAPAPPPRPAPAPAMAQAVLRVVIRLAAGNGGSDGHGRCGHPITTPPGQHRPWVKSNYGYAQNTLNSKCLSR